MTSAVAPAPTRTGRALATVCGVLFLTFLDTTIVAVTLGDVQSDLHAGVTALQWVVNAYALVFASLMLTGGSLGDRLGRKRVMLVGLGVFAAGSLLGALASSVGVLLAARAVMGVGAAASEPGTLSVIRHLYPQPRARARAIGAWAAVCGLALAFGPIAGGTLVGVGGWRAVFWFNLAVGVLLLAAAARLVPESADPRPGGVDVPGFLLGAVALAAVIFAVIGGEDAGYRAGWVVALFAVGAIALPWIRATSGSPASAARWWSRSPSTSECSPSSSSPRCTWRWSSATPGTERRVSSRRWRWPWSAARC